MDPRLNPDLPYRERPGASPAPRFDLVAAAAAPPADSSASTVAAASPYSSTSAKAAYAAAYARPASTRPTSASDDDSAKLRTARAAAAVSRARSSLGPLQQQLPQRPSDGMEQPPTPTPPRAASPLPPQ